MSNSSSNQQLKPKLPNGERECVATLIDNAGEHIVIGARTKRGLLKLITRLFPDVTVVPAHIHRTFWRKAK